MKLQLPALVMLLSSSSKKIQAGGALQGRTLTVPARGHFNTGSASAAHAGDSGRAPAVIAPVEFEPGNFEQRAHSSALQLRSKKKRFG